MPIYDDLKQLLEDVNAAGFESRAEFVQFMRAGRLQVRMAGRDIANKVLDGQLNSEIGAINAQKQANTEANNTDAVELAQIFAG